MTVHSPAAIIAEHLIECGVFTRPLPSDPTRVWPLFKNFMPDGPDVRDDVAAIYDTTGLKDGRIMATGKNLFNFGLQLRVRSRNNPDGWAKANEPQVILEAVKNLTISIGVETYLIANVSQVGPPLFLGLEDEGTGRRNLFTINYLATLKET